GDSPPPLPGQRSGDMLGVPETERGPLRQWSLAILGALEPVLSPEQLDRGVTAVEAFKVFLAVLVERRVGEGGGEAGEILSTLIDASDFKTQPAGVERLG